MYVRQKQLEHLPRHLSPGKVVVLYGARRTGKTTLIREYLKSVQEPYLSVTGEDIIVQEFLASRSIEKIKAFIGEYRLVVIDEAQAIPDIGLNLKLTIDHIPDVRVIATGSSSFDLARNIGEPLTGRKTTMRLFPLAQMEIMTTENPAQTAANLENRLIYGSYPEAVLLADNRQREQYLKELVSSYLFKDILTLDGVRHSAKIGKLLQLIALQIGHEVSCSELAGHLGMSKGTVERYLDLLEKTFVIVRLNGFSRNLRREITKNGRCYFVDTGVRNALINNFNPISIRDDIGLLWENYLVMERLKKQEYQGIFSNNYFWRTYSRQEIDWVEERGGRLYGYEIKWGKSKTRPPNEWVKAYPDASWQVVNRTNYPDFIL